MGTDITPHYVKKGQEKRLEYIDIAKGISIICIVLGHVGARPIDRLVYTFHVPIFFLITGYFINPKTTNREFCRKKVRTLLVPYFITCTVIVVLSGIINEIFLGGVESKKLVIEWGKAALYGLGFTVHEPFHIRHIGAIWFLWATFWGSIILRSLLDLRKGTRLFLVFLLFILGCWSIDVFCLPLSIQPGCCALFFMYLGYLWRRSEASLGSLDIEAKAACTVMALFVWLFFIRDFEGFYLVNCNIGRGAVDIFSSVCACYLVLMLSRQIEKKGERSSRWLAYLGRYSIFMLCIHMVEQDIFPWWELTDCLIAHGMPESLRRWVIVIGKFALIIPLVILCSKWKLARRVFGITEDNRGVVKCPKRLG